MSAPTCENCQWWNPTPSHDGFGFCHRYPPTVEVTSWQYDGDNAYSNRIQELRPETGAEDFCGEHTAKTEP